MADEKKNPLGPTGEQVQSNVHRLRASSGMTKRELSDRVTELGRTIPPLGISRIENGTRRVDADDLVALAVALGVHPAALLLPPDVTSGAVAEVTAVGSVPAREAWEWAHGMRPLPESAGREWLAWRVRALPNGWRPMSARDYAEWSAERSTAEHERILRQAGFGSDGERIEGGTDG
ncbi:helix-turn-helix domain-containing protein [Streptomyces scabiei]|uniref:helix-turn-helix domain-containing protein n=1 Tax=Streptomyces scabiei TaxID=1930 RepID=UPI0037B42657